MLSLSLLFFEKKMFLPVRCFTCGTFLKPNTTYDAYCCNRFALTTLTPLPTTIASSSSYYSNDNTTSRNDANGGNGGNGGSGGSGGSGESSSSTKKMKQQYK